MLTKRCGYCNMLIEQGMYCSASCMIGHQAGMTREERMQVRERFISKKHAWKILKVRYGPGAEGRAND